MEIKIENLLDELEKMRREVWGKDEMIYKLLGQAMGKIMDVGDILRGKVRNGS